MNPVDKYIYLYSCLYNRRGVNKYILTPFRKLVRFIAYRRLPILLENCKISKKKDVDVIVSLTSFPGRINDVHLVIRCLLNQTYRPKKILLWLSKSQFVDVKLPSHLTGLCNDIFEIRFVDEDYKSHKKYLYAFREYLDDLVLLADDDIYYETDVIEKLYKAYESKKGDVICRYGSVMKFDTSGSLLPYKTWWRETGDSYSGYNFFFGTGGGTLVKPSTLYKDVTDIDLAYKLCPTADDVWINAMVRINKLKIHKIKFGLIFEMESKTVGALANQNVYKNQNDIQIENISSFYKSYKPFSTIL